MDKFSFGVDLVGWLALLVGLVSQWINFKVSHGKHEERIKSLEKRADANDSRDEADRKDTEKKLDQILERITELTIELVRTGSNSSTSNSNGNKSHRFLKKQSNG